MASLEKSGRPGDVDRKTGRALEWLNERSPTLAALADLATAGLAVLVSAGEWVTRTITGGTGITVTNGSGASGNPTITLANTAVAPGSYTLTSLTVDAQGRITAASNGSVATAPVALADHYTDAGNSGTGETDLYSHTVSAGRLAANGQKIVAEYGGRFLASGSPRIQIYFAGTALTDTGTLTAPAFDSSWTMTVLLQRVSSTVVRYTVAIFIKWISPHVYNSTGELTGLTLSNTNILKITGQGGASNQVVAKLGYVEWKPAA